MGNEPQTDKSRAQDRTKGLPHGLQRIRNAARKDKQARFTTLLHHVNVESLETAYRSINRRAAAGIDGVTWEEYGKDLSKNLEGLHDRIHRGAYRAKPSLRSYLDKPDGGQRPLGIPTLEDKIAQTAVAAVLEAIYEEDFLGFSYGFRPKKGPHRALDALAYTLVRKKVNWVLDADIRGFFDSISHKWMMRFVEHRIADKRILRLLRKWLNAGVLEDDRLKTAKEGTPQGASISPLLANVYLHYVFDLWAHDWRRRNARGDVVFVRYADDFVVGFQHKDEAARFLRDLTARFEQFDLEIHPEKTRLIEFGRFARERRRERGEGKPETFVFLGFRHICGTRRDGKFQLRRHTCSKRLRRKLTQIRRTLLARKHLPFQELGLWISQVVAGYEAYYAVPTNRRALKRFRTEIGKAALAALRRRSGKDRTTWAWLAPRLESRLPPFRYRHPWPDERFERGRPIVGAV